jgi:hypothetical protein
MSCSGILQGSLKHYQKLLHPTSCFQEILNYEDYSRQQEYYNPYIYRYGGPLKKKQGGMYAIIFLQQ